jgi:hypothetical protein
MIYFIYEIDSITERHGWVEKIGSVNGFMIGRISKDLLPYITMIDCMVIPEHVALAYKFSMKRLGYINVRPETHQYEQLDKDKLEVYKDKYRYFMTEEDSHNGHLFDKAMMHCILNKYYNNLMMISVSVPEIFHAELGYPTIQELIDKKVVMQAKIDRCTNLEETATILNDHFGIQKDPDESTAKIDL